MADNNERSTRLAAVVGRKLEANAPRPISTPHHLHTANLLREWADMAERGELLGVVVGAMDKDMRPKLLIRSQDEL